MDLCNGLSQVPCQAIALTNADLLTVEHLNVTHWNFNKRNIIPFAQMHSHYTRSWAATFAQNAGWQLTGFARRDCRPFKPVRGEMTVPYIRADSRLTVYRRLSLDERKPRLSPDISTFHFRYMVVVDGCIASRRRGTSRIYEGKGVCILHPWP